jgi:hypothetical protein
MILWSLNKLRINRFISKYIMNIFSGKIDYLIWNSHSIKFLENRLNKMAIYASSVFSHLPKKLFTRWLQTLNKLGNGNGMLIFTVHDLSLFN